MSRETPKSIRRLLVANRSEIAIRVFRSAHELGIRTVAIYSHEDRFALHRFKADEAYRTGKPGEPLRAYLDIEGIVALARRHDGILFIGPRVDILEKLGDKVTARHIAQQAKVPVPAGSDTAVRD